MLHIKFRYREPATKDETWSEQECVASSLKECKEFYGLDQPDVEYEIVRVEDVG